MKDTNRKLKLNKQEIACLNESTMNMVKGGLNNAQANKKNETKPYDRTSGCTGGCSLLHSLWNCTEHECSNNCPDPYLSKRSDCTLCRTR